MTELLAQVFKKASALPLELQDALAREFLKEIEWENQWDKTFLTQICAPTCGSQFVHVPYSVRIGMGWRTVGFKRTNIIVWFWIGSHADYDRLIQRY